MKDPHWQYYKSILEDLSTLARYVEISPDNYTTYGLELTRLLLSVGSEIDVVAKLLCKTVNADASAENIEDYHKTLCAKFPGLPDVEVSIPNHLISLTPWHDWFEKKPPKWWSCYNKVKHKRDEHFREANLENVLLATAALCILVLYLYYDHLDDLGLHPPFMFLDQRYRTGDVKALVTRYYVLPDFEQTKDVT